MNSTYLYVLPVKTIIESFFFSCFFFQMNCSKEPILWNESTSYLR